VKARLTPLRRDTCPFAEEPELNAPTTWVEPKAVAEVSFHSWTDDDHLRAPVFARLRDDVDAASVRRPKPEARLRRSRPIASPVAATGPIDEILAQLQSPKATMTLEVGPHRIKLTNLDRVYWPANPSVQQPALTKRDLLRYCAQVSPYMLPHLADRPLTMIRMPDGIRGQRFFQKHWEQERPSFVETITVFSGHKDEQHDYLLCNNLPTLLWLAQSGTLEFHIWHSRDKWSPTHRARRAPTTRAPSPRWKPRCSTIPTTSYSTSIRTSIQARRRPGAEPELNTIAFEKGKEVAFWLRELLQSMSLDAIVKTSGKTGLHVFVPIRRTIDFDAARHVSELVGRHLMRRHPKDITLEWSVPKRTGKIFMDYNMNVRGKTLNVAYSPRGEPGAPVSMPLTWESSRRLTRSISGSTTPRSGLAQNRRSLADALERKQNLEKAVGMGKV
jgi:bifunctional non-homologous end joining protein LigD